MRVGPALRGLLDSAVASGAIRADVGADDLVSAISSLCMSAQGREGLDRARRMVALLADGLRVAVPRGRPM